MPHPAPPPHDAPPGTAGLQTGTAHRPNAVTTRTCAALLTRAALRPPPPSPCETPAGKHDERFDPDVGDRKEGLSRAYVQAVAAAAGYTLAEQNFDLDGVDVQVRAGGAMRPSLDMQ